MSTTTSGVEGVELEAGRELDALIAERVMGRTVSPGVGGFDGRAGWHNDFGFTDTRHPRNPPYVWGEDLPESNANYKRVPHYSTDIAAAWEVVEKLHGMGYECSVIKCGDEWECDVYLDRSNDRVIWGTADTAPLAICRAALAATSRTTNPEASSGDE